MYNNPRWLSWSHLTSITDVQGQPCDFVRRTPLIAPSRCTAKQASTSMLFFSGRALTGHEIVTVRRKKKLRQAAVLLEVSLKAFLSLWVAKGQNLQVGFFFPLEKREKMMLTLESPIVSLHHTSEGSSDFYWAYGWHFDFDSALLTLMLTPAVFLQKRLGHIRVVCPICTVYLLC